jgi:hypothetical protein
MFRQLTAFIIFFAFVAQSLSGLLVMVDYYANRSAYFKTCINKGRPKLHCNGKCQMMKKMQEEGKKEQQLPERKYENKFEVLSSKSFFCYENPPVILGDTIAHCENNNHTQDISLDIFHPPQA